jgi:hypothetical protein
LTEEKEAQAYLKKVATSIKFLNKNARKQAFLRGQDVLAEIFALKKYDYGVMRETRDISRFELIAGIQRYLIGFFDDSIYHSTLSVEMGLLIRLDEELSENEKEQIHQRINSQDGPPFSFTFGAIFDEAKRKNRKIMTDEKMQKKIAKIIETRNTHIHASNFTAATIQSSKEVLPLQIEKGLTDIELIEKTPVKMLMNKSLSKMKKFLVDTNSTIESLPSFEWCTKDKQRSRTHNGVSSHFNEQFALIDAIKSKQPSLTEKIRVGAHSAEFVRGFSEDSYPKRMAMETIKDSFDVLHGLGLFG